MIKLLPWILMVLALVQFVESLSYDRDFILHDDNFLHVQLTLALMALAFSTTTIDNNTHTPKYERKDNRGGKMKMYLFYLNVAKI